MSGSLRRLVCILLGCPDPKTAWVDPERVELFAHCDRCRRRMGAVELVRRVARKRRREGIILEGED